MVAAADGIDLDTEFFGGRTSFGDEDLRRPFVGPGSVRLQTRGHAAFFAWLIPTLSNPDTTSRSEKVNPNLCS